MEIAEIEQQIRRLRSKVQSLTALFVVFLLGWFGWWLLVDRFFSKPSITVDNNHIRFSILSDGPYVISHVAAYGDSESEKRWASLNPPIAVIDSEGADIEMSKLTWYDLRGKVAEPPPKEAKFSVLYYQPDRVQSRKTVEAP